MLDQTEQLKILRDLIQIQSPNGNEITVSKYIGQLFDKYGIHYRLDAFGDRRADLVAQIGNEESTKILGFTGHQDTVSVSNPDQWQHDPFSAAVVGDQVFGRGAADMKSGLAAQIIALIDLKQAGLPKHGQIRFIATAGEEYGTPGAFRLNDQHVVDDVAALVVGEPTSGQVVYAHSGSINYRVKSFGQATHSSTPQKGINAISGLNQFINREATLFDQTPIDPFFGHVQHIITMIKGGEQVNIIPAAAELSGNIRPTESFNNDAVIRTLKQAVVDINAASHYRLEFSLIHNFFSVETDPQNGFVQLAKQAATAHFTDRQVDLLTINGATDASVFVQANPQMPVVVLGPDAWAEAHQTDEFTTISSFRRTIGTYEQLAQDYFHEFD